MNEQTRSRTMLIVSLIFSIALVFCAGILAHALVRIRSGDEIIRVTGSAQEPIRSDFIIWDGKITEQATTMAAAYGALQSSGAKVRKYLTSQGIPASEISSSAVSTKTLYARVKGDDTSAGVDDGDDSSGTFRQVQGYQLSQTFEVQSDKVDLVDDVSRRSTELISSGVPFESTEPEYLYNKLGDLKVKMLAAAAKDARNRADQIAVSAGCRLGDVRFAHMGVLQIEPLYTAANANSDEISDTGTNDTSSLDKKIIAVVTIGFAAQ